MTAPKIDSLAQRVSAGLVGRGGVPFGVVPLVGVPFTLDIPDIRRVIWVGGEVRDLFYRHNDEAILLFQHEEVSGAEGSLVGHGVGVHAEKCCLVAGVGDNVLEAGLLDPGVVDTPPKHVGVAQVYTPDMPRVASRQFPKFRRDLFEVVQRRTRRLVGDQATDKSPLGSFNIQNPVVNGLFDHSFGLFEGNSIHIHQFTILALVDRGSGVCRHPSQFPRPHRWFASWVPGSTFL